MTTPEHPKDETQSNVAPVTLSNPLDLDSDIDEYTFKAVQEWRAVRAQIVLYHATLARERQGAPLPWTVKDDVNELHHRLNSVEGDLIHHVPVTIGGCIELLNVAQEIMAAEMHRPKHSLSDGPALQLVANVAEALADGHGRIDREARS